ncbi:hypothetical protein PISL3812_03066 [Talaromyces islandicus]|uniref:Impact N-terminal domain-containing protein n=1 Tax=Talaromyces islandicus TaxID=28573 RepID=A0A0U1LRP9_TALIS|nr:hypothetical protein PISL3812_03066 [Talaromyces islandicus]
MAAQLQALLRFLSQDAKVPLASAIGKVRELQTAGLHNANDIASSDLKTVQAVFNDNKIAKQVHNAAKRVAKKSSNKRGAPEDDASSPSASTSSPKRPKRDLSTATTPFEIESALTLPIASEIEEELSTVVLQTNRAPLVLAFAVGVTKYTMPEQPISSRLSLGQAVVSANSRSKAVSLGLESGKSAEEEGWGRGQPTIRILGREIPVLKRWDYDPNEGRPDEEAGDEQKEKEKAADNGNSAHNETSPPLWGLDLESLRKRADEPGRPSRGHSHTPGLPIHTAESARSYLLKAFSIFKEQADESSNSPQKTKAQKAISVSEKERALGLLLQSLDIVFSSWASTLSLEELDRRAWSWYVRVRPDIQSGVAGWGEKGKVKLSDILALKR